MKREGLKEIWAILRSSNLAQETKEELLKAGVTSYTRFRAYGRGKQGGLYSSQAGQETKLAPVVQFLPRVVFYMVVPSSKCLKVIEILIKTNQTRSFGDGKIFVGNLGQAFDCRSKELEK